MRRRSRNLRLDDTDVALANFALTFAKALLVFCVILFLLIAPERKKDEGVKPKMEYLISVSWPLTVDADIDVWMRDPDGQILWYANKEVGFANLERDDMGRRNNRIYFGDKEVVKLNNEELISLRGFKPGEYALNVHLYSHELSFVPNEQVSPIQVRVVITKMNPSVETVWAGNATLTHIREEAHVLRFKLDIDGKASEFETGLPLTIREKIKGQEGTTPSLGFEEGIP